MNCLLYSGQYRTIYSALLRYFRYIFNNELCYFDESTVENWTPEFLFYFTDDKYHTVILSICESKLSTHLVSLGFSDKTDINLLDLSNLRQRIGDIIQCRESLKPVFSRDELIDQVTQFFKTHGEESLLQGLNNTIYCLQNGIIMYNRGDLEWEEAREKFLLPGLDWWRRFTGRFQRYRHFFSMLGIYQEIVSVDDKITIFSKFADCLESPTKSAIREVQDETVKINIACLNEINDILIEIANWLNIKIK